MEELREGMEKKVGLNNHEWRPSPKDQELIMDNEQQPGAPAEKQNSGKKNDQKTSLRTPADILEYPSFYLFVLDMPGLEAQNIKVKVEAGILHVIGKKKKKKQMEEFTSNENVKVIRIERRRARYMRKFNLASDASHEDVKAIYKDGVLSITVPKNPSVEQSNSNSNSDTNIATSK